MVHSSHHNKHPLEMVNNEGVYTCDGCKMDGKGQRYRCKKCDFDLHIDCMFNSDVIKIEGQIHQFLAKPPIGINCKRAKCRYCRSCNACGITVKGFVYHCPITDFDFHPLCANLRNEIIVDDVTFLVDKQGPTSSCVLCKKKKLKGAPKNNPGWSYVCKYEDYSFHVYCMMTMGMQSSSSSNNINSYNEADLAVQGISLSKDMRLTMKSKATFKNSKWFNILKIFLGTVFSILLGDPTTIIASTTAHLILEGLSNA